MLTLTSLIKATRFLSSYGDNGYHTIAGPPPPQERNYRPTKPLKLGADIRKWDDEKKMFVWKKATKKDVAKRNAELKKPPG
ncbi:MAG TPA: hypothetical protein VHP58_06105 [Alphaproteobacteria bacterium]|nr:hypothetical protein [Alphaproteobacteria bacterium]